MELPLFRGKLKGGAVCSDLVYDVSEKDEVLLSKCENFVSGCTGVWLHARESEYFLNAFVIWWDCVERALNRSARRLSISRLKKFSTEQCSRYIPRERSLIWQRR